jgi:hypothetical protein
MIPTLRMALFSVHFTPVSRLLVGSILSAPAVSPFSSRLAPLVTVSLRCLGGDWRHCLRGQQPSDECGGQEFSLLVRHFHAPPFLFLPASRAYLSRPITGDTMCPALKIHTKVSEHPPIE